MGEGEDEMTDSWSWADEPSREFEDTIHGRLPVRADIWRGDLEHEHYYEDGETQANNWEVDRCTVS